jgi:hypothetical protein
MLVCFERPGLAQRAEPPNAEVQEVRRAGAVLVEHGAHIHVRQLREVVTRLVDRESEVGDRRTAADSQRTCIVEHPEAARRAAYRRAGPNVVDLSLSEVGRSPGDRAAQIGQRRSVRPPLFRDVTCRLRSWNSRDVSREALSGAVLERAPPAPGASGRGQDTEEVPSMLADRRPPAESSADAQPVAGLVRTHWVLSVCVVCGHEQPRGENSRATCPGCGAQLRSFALYRDLHASR